MTKIKIVIKSIILISLMLVIKFYLGVEGWVIIVLGLAILYIAYLIGKENEMQKQGL